jgi:membrane fusion protein (multidrug efflux system)
VVESGLKSGERVIVNGVDKAKPGTIVKTVPATLPAAPVAAADGANSTSGTNGASIANAASGVQAPASQPSGSK